MKFLMRKLIALVLTVLAVSIVTFLAFRIIPGDSATVLAGTEGVVKESEKKNVLIEYKDWVINVLSGDFGDSTQFKMPVSQLVGERLMVTLQLAGMTMLIIVMVSLPLGIICAKKPGGILDNIIMFISNVFMATPVLIARVVILVSSRLVIVWVTTQRCVSSNWLTMMKIWLRQLLLRRLVLVALRRMLLKHLLQKKLQRLNNLYQTIYLKGCNYLLQPFFCSKVNILLLLLLNFVVLMA